LKGLSCLKRKFLEQFLGEGVMVTSPSYPAAEGAIPSLRLTYAVFQRLLLLALKVFMMFLCRFT
jgi:hypothetical protein